ncbi:2-amino-3,7-dideoxy-D-threo-hept-6-ulosonate synthase [Desulfobaculum bizertense]|uniref:class I fructose-bisphosphate aldolase n=1 Tax=Desulfobaculum bizertense TaxID=376490 RepID=UPI001F2B7DAE|nr:2-amino-3,7-dideoxy-D-threo-hept-6-ulosonate synthase [Desulfobaculum bizertense]UIJ37388.1 2-amino-3,7-dideoxy-D-threo-hept-6-ulosonate synthase [Desulfobaculum bizertense]
MRGVTRRTRRLFETKSGRVVLLPLDHGASEGMLSGLEAYPELIRELNETPVQGVILNKGLARTLNASIPLSTQLIVQLTAGTKHGVPTYNQSLVCTPEEALRLGADAVSFQMTIGNDLEEKMLQEFAATVDNAHQLGLPLIASISARGGQIVNELDSSLVGHCIRLGGELGADAVCVPYSGSASSFTRAVQLSPIPVLVMGGPMQPNWKNFLGTMKQALQTGISGVSVGRNIFQHKEPKQALKELCELIHEPEPEEENGHI